MVALLRSTARSQLVQSILSPIVHAMEKDLQRTMALMNTKQESQNDKVRPGQSDTAPDDLWKASDDPASKAEEGQQNSAGSKCRRPDAGSTPLFDAKRAGRIETWRFGTAARGRSAIPAKRQRFQTDERGRAAAVGFTEL